MARLARGEEQALTDLMERHGKRLTSDLNRILKNGCDAADIVQETFLRVFKHRLRYDFGSSFSGWLYTIALNLARSHFRWLSRQPESVPLDTVHDSQKDVDFESLIDPSLTPREQTLAREWTTALDKALAALPAPCREALQLVILDGCSQPEAAAQVGCSVKAIETRIYHGRKYLRTAIHRLLNPWPRRIVATVRQSSETEKRVVHGIVSPVDTMAEIIRKAL